MTEADLIAREITIAKKYGGRDLFERRETTIIVLDITAERYFSLVEFQSEISDAERKVPADLKGGARVELLEDGFARLRISYERQETDEEFESRVSDALSYARRRVATERDEHERWKQKNNQRGKD